MHINTRLLGIFAEIAGMGLLNTDYTDVLHRKLEATGKPVEDMTIREVLDIHRECKRITSGGDR